MKRDPKLDTADSPDAPKATRWQDVGEVPGPPAGGGAAPWLVGLGLLGQSAKGALRDVLKPGGAALAPPLHAPKAAAMWVVTWSAPWAPSSLMNSLLDSLGWLSATRTGTPERLFQDLRALGEPVLLSGLRYFRNF